MHNVEMNVGISAEYDLLLQKVVVDEAGAPVLDRRGKPIPVGAPRKVHSQKNLITNTGMNWWGTNTNAPANFGVYCRVGGGSTEPANTDTALASPIANVSRSSGDATVAWGTGEYLNCAVITLNFSFGVGAAAGNLTEVGLGNTASDSLLTRSLFKDPSGNPITINVAPDEQLLVYYRVIIRPDTADKTFSVTTSPTPTAYTITLRPAQLGVRSLFFSGRFGVVADMNNQAVYYGTSSGIGPITGSPTGTRSAFFVATAAWGAFTPGTFERTDTYTIGSANGNHSDIGAIEILGGVPFSWQVGISPRLTKVSPETIKITILNKWSRD